MTTSITKALLTRSTRNKTKYHVDVLTQNQHRYIHDHTCIFIYKYIMQNMKVNTSFRTSNGARFTHGEQKLWEPPRLCFVYFQVVALRWAVDIEIMFA